MSSQRYFECEVNGAKIQADPVDAYLRYMEYLDTHDIDPQEIDQFLRDGAQVGKVRGDYKYMRFLANAVKHMFGVKSFDEDKEKGLTIAELMQVFGQFMTYAAAAKKNIEDLQSPSPSTEETSSA